MTTVKELLPMVQLAINETLGLNISQNELADRAGCSAATLSQVKAGNWDAIGEQMVLKLAGYFRVNQDRTEWRLFDTENYRTVRALCEDARVGRWMLGLSAATGTGKTTALREYARRTAGVTYVLATYVMRPTHFLHAIQVALGQKPAAQQSAAITAIVEKLAKVENPLLIIDDAGKLNTENDSKKEVMPIVQVLVDAYEDRTARRLGVVLAGTPTLYKRLMALADQDRNAYPELVSRVRCWETLVAPSKESVSDIAKHYDITDPAALKQLKHKATNYRLLRDLIVTAKQVTAGNGEAITAELLLSLPVGLLEVAEAPRRK